jgi:MFS family permease
MSAPLGRWLARTFINRNFALFILGTAGSGTGYWFLLVALGWLVLELGNSTFLLGLATFAQMAPMFVLGLFGGVVADRFNRKTIMLAAQLVVAAANAVLALAASLGLLTIPVILACSLVFGLANSVLWPTWSVFIKDLVGAAHLRQAVALNAARFNLTRVVGPALAGIMLQHLGPAWCLWVGLLSSLGIIATILLMRLPPWQPPPAAGSVLTSVREALTAVWQTPPVRRLLGVTGMIGLVALPFQAFLPALARDSLRAGPDVLGLLTAAVGAGAILGALGSGAPLARARPAWTLTALAAGVVAGLALLAAATTLWLALVALGLLGLATIGFLSIANASIQLGVPDALVGRVMGLWVVMNAGTQPIGSLIEGAIAERWGLGMTFAGAALICGLAVVWLVAQEAARGRQPSAISPR